MRICCDAAMIVAAALVALAGTVAVMGKAKGAKKRDPAKRVEAAIRALHAGMASPKKEERVKALKRVLPGKREIEVLFPKHAGKLWPLIEKKLNEEFVEHVDDIAKELTKHGPVEEVKLTDVRGDKTKRKTYRAVLRMIPKDVPLYDCTVYYKKSASGGPTYLVVKDRVIAIPDFDAMPEVIRELENPKKKPL